ncbi:hypothetical protein BH18ACI4_BH18ACI4_17300 [soil metagenome]
MLIICDHCSRPISGTVERVTGNFNLHRDCLAQLGKPEKPESNSVPWRRQKHSVSPLRGLERNQNGR